MRTCIAAGNGAAAHNPASSFTLLRAPHCKPCRVSLPFVRPAVWLSIQIGHSGCADHARFSAKSRSKYWLACRAQMFLGKALADRSSNGLRPYSPAVRESGFINVFIKRTSGVFRWYAAGTVLICLPHYRMYSISVKFAGRMIMNAGALPFSGQELRDD